MLRAGMTFYGGREWRRVERMAQSPATSQQHVLTKLLFTNRDTRFGAAHGFADIRDAARFRDRVAVQDYESLRPFIEEQRLTGVSALTAEAPLFYAQTSGTTGKPKNIPVTPSMLAMHRAEQALFAYLQFRACPEAFAGKTLGIVGAAVENRLDTGHAVGAASGHVVQSLPRPVRARLVLPQQVSRITDYDLKYLVILRLALGQSDITYMGAANPSTFLRLLDILAARRDELLESLMTGTLPALDGLDGGLRDVIARELRPAPERAAQLRDALALTYENLWPGIRLVTTWTGGSCGIALAALRKRLPPRAAVMELGYQSSECQCTIALTAETPGGLPPLHHHFFEFVEQGSWDGGRPEFLTLDELEVGKRYYILITTAAGLYRYFMNDLVEVTGLFHRTPLLRFVQKGKGVTSITGEKLYEAQAIEAVRGAAERFHVTTRFFLLVADEEASSYALLLEPDDGLPPEAEKVAAAIGVAMDERLGELNIEYHAKRTSGRLRPPTVAWLKRGAAEAHKAACVQAGQREGQFKPAVLQYRKDLVLPFHDYVTQGSR